MALLTPRQGLTDISEPLLSPRQGLTSIGTFESPRQGLTAITRDLLSPRQGVTSIFSEDFLAIASSPVSSEWISSFRNQMSVPRPSLTYAGLDLSDLLGDVSFSTPLNGKSTCSFTLGNPTTNGIVTFPSPTCPPGTGDYSGIIRQHNGTATRKFYFSLSYAGQTWTSNPYVPTIPTHDGNNLAWGGDDLAAILETVPESPLDDILLGDGDLVMAHAAAKQHADAAGITVDLRFPDYLVGELRRGNMSHLAAMDALAKPMQAGRRWQNGVLIYEQVNTGAPAMWRFIDRLNIRKFTVSEYPRAFNSFVLARFSPAGGQIGRKSGNTVGRQSITFDSPARSVFVDTVRVEQGSLVDWVFFDEAGNVVSGGSGGIEAYSGGTPVVRAEFTYLPRIGQNAFTPAWECIVRGEPKPRESSYRSTADSSAHQAVYGVVKAPAISEPTLGDQAGADNCIAAYLAESTRKVYKANLETPYLNPYVLPGHVVQVTDRDTAQSGSLWVVENVSLAWSGKSCSMSLELSRGL